jgi:hypothetical protein
MTRIAIGLLAGVAMWIGLSGAALSASNGEFVGKVVVEWLDSGANRSMRLVEDFAYADAHGKLWQAPKAHILDGSAIPPAFLSFVGPAFSGQYRKAAVVHDYQCHAKAQPWLEVHRMFFAANLAAGIDESEAKVMYMAVYAQGPRWEPKEGSRCYRSCHAAAEMLHWRPVVPETDLRPLVEWIEQENPALDAIDARVDAITKKPGPHLFAQGH